MTTSSMLSDRAERHISKIVAKCYHGTETLDRKGYSKTVYTTELNLRQKQPISRARMFSPSSCVSDVKEFCNQVIESRKKKGIKVLQEKETSDRYSIETNDWREIDQQQFETVKKIHSNLIDKTSSLVERAKQSRFLGFFSPRRLRNRIKLGNFSQIPCSKIITKRRALSPCSIYPSLNNVSSLTIPQKYYMCVDKTLIKDPKYKISHKLACSRANKLKINSEKYQNSFCNQNLSADEDFFKTQ